MLNGKPLFADGLKPYTTIPMAPGRLPILGHLLAILKFFKRPQLHIPLLQWARSQGPVYRCAFHIFASQRSLCLCLYDRSSICQPAWAPRHAAVSNEVRVACRVEYPPMVFPNAVAVLDTSLMPVILGRPGLRKQDTYNIFNVVCQLAVCLLLFCDRSCMHQPHACVWHGWCRITIFKTNQLQVQKS